MNGKRSIKENLRVLSRIRRAQRLRAARRQKPWRDAE